MVNYDTSQKEVRVQIDDQEIPQAGESAPETPEVSSTPSETSSESKETLLDAVLKTVDVTEEETVEKLSEPSDKLTPEDGDQQEDEESQTEDEAAPEEEIQEGVPAPVKRKLRKLQKEAVKYKRELETMRPTAEIGQQLQNYASVNNLSSEDVVFSLDLAAMVARGDYQGFYKVISPLIRHAQEVSGVVLPPDVQGLVDQQQMTPAAAAEYARARFERQNFEHRARTMEEQQRSQQSAMAREDVQRSVSAFEQRLSAQDPDYRTKAPAVRRAVQAMLLERGGRVTNAQEALSITQAAYDEVNKLFRRNQQPLKATAPTPGSANPQTPSARAAPKSLMEAALQGLAKSR